MKNELDLLVKNVNIFNSYFKKFINADVYIKNEKFYHIDYSKNSNLKTKSILNGKNKFMIPGLIDIHMHIESSMLTPSAFCNYVSKCGVTTIVSEPHEMANVNGINGVLDMINDGEKSLIDVYYGIPSSVPSLSKELETTGGEINFEHMMHLLDNENIICVGEIMNYRKIIEPNNLEITKFLEKLQIINKNFVIEGHCPSLIGEALSKFLYLGINGDHTEHNLEEIKERFLNGMFIEVQDKMIHKWLIDYIDINNLYEHFAFVTDDVMADILLENGHLNTLIKKAVSLGMKIENAIYCATYTPSRRMQLFDRGIIAPGKIADFIIIDDINNFSIYETFKNGKCIYNKNYKVNSNEKIYNFPNYYYKSINTSMLVEKDLILTVDSNIKKVDVRVINISDGSTKTTESTSTLLVKNGIILWEDTNLCMAVVKERYHGGLTMGIGFVSGDCIKKGAVSSSYAHDSHNILAIGKTTKEIVTAMNKVISLNGGIVTCENNNITSELQLKVGGIISDKSVDIVGTSLKNVRSQMINLGYNHYNPIMSLCTLTLPVSPSLKLTDKGLIDVKNAKLVDLIIKKY